MPREYVRKTDCTPPDPDYLLEALRAIIFDKQKVFAISKSFGISRTNLYRLVKKFDEEIGTELVVTEEELKDFVNSRKTSGGKTVNYLIFFEKENYKINN